MRKEYILLGLAASTSAALITWALLRPRDSFAKTQNQSVGKPESVVLIGDSQTARHLGNAFMKAFSESNVEFFGRSGATHEDYLNDPELIQQIQNLPCADVVYIQLGDNGVPSNTDTIKTFVNVIKTKCPNARMYWGGPMKAVKPSFSSNYVNTDDPNSSRYLPKYNELRKVWIERLRSALDGTGVIFVDNYTLQESQPTSAAFSDSRGGDGVHLLENSADELATLIKGVVEGVS